MADLPDLESLGLPSPRSPRAAVALVLAAGLTGGVLLGLLGPDYPLPGLRCDRWPSLPRRSLGTLGYVVAVLLFTLAWLTAQGAAFLRGRTLLQVLAVGTVIHAAAALSPPFLSQDPLFYAAIGRVIDAYHRSPFESFAANLPPGDPFRAVMPPNWVPGTSAYMPGFHALCQLVARLGGSEVAVHLRLFQVLGFLSMAATGLLTALAGPREDRPRLLALVLLCPLALIEGTLSAHNDGLLAVAAALFALSLRRGGRLGPVLALAALASGMLVKISALLLLCFYCAFLFQHLVIDRAPASRRRALQVILVVAALAAAVLAIPYIRRFTMMLGSPTDEDDHCTISPECGPRMILHGVFNMPVAAFALGLAFRAGGLLWLLVAARRAARLAQEGSPSCGAALGYAAMALGGYYMYLHGWFQLWYLLPLLPLIPFADPRERRALSSVCVSGVLANALDIVWLCTGAPPLDDEHVYLRIPIQAAKGVLTLGPATYLLLRKRNPPSL